MDKHTKSLELNKILSMLANETSCEDAKVMAIEIQPSSDINKVKMLLDQTYDAHMLMGRFGSPSFSGINNTTNSLRRASSGGVLTTCELIKIADNLKVMRSIKEWRKRSESMQTHIDWLFNEILPNKFLEDKITSSILSEDEISDTASPELADIRRKIRNHSNRVREQLDKLIRSTKYQEYLQDNIVTMRSDRYVVPVKAEFRGEIQGLVHDTSSSGATVFIEPISVVESNNEIKVLRSKEQIEIERILFNLSKLSGEFADNIILGYNALIHLNVIFAKASLAYKMKASLPIVNDQGKINLKKARHPLIDAEKVVPTNINLGLDFDTLVITGPNTGGKTVSLKTIGLFALMAMCGLMIPADDNSSISVFDRVLADIGDEQSIEQSLSTFSAHMTNIVKIVDQADNKSLVLLDELGAGTDPIEGAALAISILETLRKKGAKIASTTHYAELKEYALKTDNVENACCEFDVSTLKPTYKLLIGVPGRSNAFAISERLGMPHEIVEKARTLVSAEDTHFADIVEKLESTRQKLEQERKQVEKDLADARKSKKEAEEHLNKIKRESDYELEKARTEARNLVARTRAQSEHLLDELDMLKKKNNALSAEERAKINSSMRTLENTADPIEGKDKQNYVLPRKLKIGDNVLIQDLNKKATVLELQDTSGNVMVQAGVLKLRTPVDNLRLLDERPVKKPQRTTTRNVKGQLERSASTSIDLRGKNALEATMELDSFIDSAILSGVSSLTIIHGKGTGVLRKEIQLYLKKHPSIKSYRLGVFGEGESGVTIAELK